MTDFIDRLPVYFSFTTTEIIVLIVLSILVIIQLYFYLKYYNKPTKYKSQFFNDEKGDIQEKYSKVSVIIVSENESENLSKNLPSILKQNYPDFEVIVVNNGSTDESEELLETLKQQNPNLYHTFLPTSPDKYFKSKKLAMTLGIKAAKGDILLFTEPYCRPISEEWINEMVKPIQDNTEIVIGYSYYKKERNSYNAIARFDNLLTSIQYLSLALSGKPCIATYRNIAYKKSLFFDNKGFSSTLHLNNGEEAFLNKIITPENTVVAITDKSFTEGVLYSKSLWKDIKRSYVVMKKNMNKKYLSVFSIEIITRYLTYIIFILAAIYGIIKHQWGFVFSASILFIIRETVQLFTIKKASDSFLSEISLPTVPLLDAIQPLFNLKIKVRKSK